MLVLLDVLISIFLTSIQIQSLPKDLNRLYEKNQNTKKSEYKENWDKITNEIMDTQI